MRPPPINIGEPALRAAWDAAVRASDAANTRATEIEAASGTVAEITSAEEAASVVDEQLDDVAEQIIRAPVRGFADIKLLAEACFRTLWTGRDLNVPDADAVMADGPDHDVEGICAEALAALLRGVRDLIGSTPAPTATEEEWAAIQFEPVDISFDQKEFAARYFPTVCVGLAVLQRDADGVAGIVREMVADGEEGGELFTTLLENLEAAKEKFGALAEFMSAAHTRLVAGGARAALEQER